MSSYRPEDGAQTARPASVSKYHAGIDQVRFWVGALLTAGIAAGAALIGLVLIRGVLQIPILVTSSHPVDVAAYTLLTVAIAIGASALYDLMLHVAPHPSTYYGALAAVLIALAVLLPFTIPVGLVSQGSLAGLNLVVGLVIAFLVPIAAVRAVAKSSSGHIRIATLGSEVGARDRGLADGWSSSEWVWGRRLS